jgi:hypothetical protein
VSSRGNRSTVTCSERPGCLAATETIDVIDFDGTATPLRTGDL